MLKRIAVAALKPGMYVAAITRQAGQMQIRTEGLLRDQLAINALTQLGIEEVLIDVSRQTPASGVGTDIQRDVIPADAAVTDADKTKSEKMTTVPFEMEIGRANQLYEDALAALDALLRNASNGKLGPNTAVLGMVKQFMASLLRNADALMCLAHLREGNRYLLEHALNSCVLMTVFARARQLPESDVEALALGALWHDIGKIRIESAIFDKPGRLTSEEFQEVRRHVDYGLEIIAGLSLRSVLTRAAIAEHHERLDGSGYPGRLRGEQISVAGRMMAIVDSYDALTGYRAYRGSVTSVGAFKTLRADSYALYDAELLMIFIKAIGFYPAGTLVKLKSQRLAMVIAANPDKPYSPLVKVFYHGRFRQPLPIQELDLAAAGCDDDIDAAVRPEQFKVDLLQFFRTAVLPA